MKLVFGFLSYMRVLVGDARCNRGHAARRSDRPRD